MAYEAINKEYEIILTEIGHAEGPVVLEDGRCVFCECYQGRLGVLNTDGSRGIYAETGGGPNGAVLGLDGVVYVANNGGAVGPFRSADFGPGTIQRVLPNGEVETLLREVGGRQLLMPNDIVFGKDGRLYFTDPGRWDAEERPDDGYIYAFDISTGQSEVIASVGKSYPNGIVGEPDGSIVWVETYTQLVKRRRPSGEIETIHMFSDSQAMPDGLAVAANGDLYVATLSSGGLHVIAANGDNRFIDLGGTELSNCVFQGPDLFMTDLGSKAGVTDEALYVGRLLSIKDLAPSFDMFRG